MTDNDHFNGLMSKSNAQAATKYYLISTLGTVAPTKSMAIFISSILVLLLLLVLLWQEKLPVGARLLARERLVCLEAEALLAREHERVVQRGLRPTARALLRL